MADEWMRDDHALTEGSLRTLQELIENESDILVEHRFYRGSRAPHKFVCGDYHELRAYLEREAKAGDSFYFWVLERRCTVENVELWGKIPDEHGRIPRGGSY